MRLIDADALLNAFKETSRYFDVKFDIEQAPTIPYRPSAKWICKKEPQYYWYECSQCGERRPRDMFGKEHSSTYCPNCGAYMTDTDSPPF